MKKYKNNKDHNHKYISFMRNFKNLNKSSNQNKNQVYDQYEFGPFSQSDSQNMVPVQRKHENLRNAYDHTQSLIQYAGKIKVIKKVINLTT